MEGFTYNGIHCSTYNVGYIPDPADRWFEDPEFENYQKDVSWKHGGYYYGNAVKIRTISVKCYFEEIDTATREKIRKWLGRNTSGKLIFDDRPFVYYNVRPNAVVPGKTYTDTGETMSGTFEIKFVAMEPFGYMTRKSGITDDGAEDYCGIIPTSEMPSSPSTSSMNFNVYNPGTEECGMSVKLAGSCSNPFRLFNQRNGSQCVIDSLPSNSLYLDIDGDTGKIITYLSTPDVGAENGFAYHDHGFVALSPCERFETSNFTSGSNNKIVPHDLTVTKDMIGGRTYQQNQSTTKTSTIIDVDVSENALYLSDEIWESSVAKANIYTGNRIVIEEKNSPGNWVTPTTVSLSHISIDYNPRLL